MKALNDGPFKTGVFVKRISEKVSKIGACADIIDVQPMIRERIFNIIYGKSTQRHQITKQLLDGNMTICFQNL